MATDNQPPVEAIQGEARGYAAVIPADREAAGDLHSYLYVDEAPLANERIRAGKCDKSRFVQAFAKHRVAFQSEARAAPSASLPADREAIARIIEEVAWRCFDQTCMPYAENRGAKNGEQFWYELTWRAGCRSVADVKAWWLNGVLDGTEPVVVFQLRDSLAKADAILALSPTPSAGRDGGGDDISAMAQFLCDRLDNLDWQDFEDTTRDFMGHVDPALSRLKKALAALPPATEKAEK